MKTSMVPQNNTVSEFVGFFIQILMHDHIKTHCLLVLLAESMMTSHTVTSTDHISLPADCG